jgi:hypothetical protein
MQTIIYKSDINGTKAIGNSNPLPVFSAYDTSISFNVSEHYTNALNAVIVKQATDSKSIYLTDVTISTGQASWVQLLDVDGTIVLNKIYMAANQTVNVVFATPKKVTVSKNLMVKSGSQVYLTIDANGYVI